MAESGFHFASPWWLLGLLLIFPVGAWLRRSRVYGHIARINRYADSHLLPHLTGSRELHSGERWRRFRHWALLWTLLVLAMAGPRWDFTEIQLYTPGADLVILLDISRSMEVADVQPSRMVRARQEIEDLLNHNQGVRLGLIGFASVANVITPITEDGQSIRNLLPSISSELVRLQGSRLREALVRAATLLAGQPEDSRRSILLISDGDFVDSDLEQMVQALAEEGIRLHVLGIGTTGGGPVPGISGRFLLDNRRQPVESRLDEAGLKRLAQLGNGIYQTADYRDNDTRRILQLAQEGGKAKAVGEERARVWNERFYWLVIAVMLALLPAFRRHRTINQEEQN
ncbi:MAG: VWA domain-containing protein [Gammaproteobacteria bacterium]|nr:VWA domain-containing protein [Gammaproteobacteria bacterium]MCP5415790.1 VWA domain-containing protein [Chromatiaceae bacterium]